MKEGDAMRKEFQALRQRAEELARKTPDNRSQDPATLSPEETRRLIHELKVHQIELEMQNDELRRAQLELELSRARYFDLYELAPVGYFTLSEKGVILEANLTAASLLGEPRSAFANTLLSSIVLREDQDKYDHYRKLLIQTNSLQRCEIRLVRRDRSHVWVSLETTLAHDADGGVSYRVVVSDITERREAEARLRESENFLKETQMVAGLGTYGLDLASGKAKSSEIFRRIFGIDEEFDHSVLGWASLLHPEDREMMVDYLTNDVMGRRQVFDREYRIIRHHDGAERWLHGFGRLELNTDGLPVRLIGAVQDITEHKQAEAYREMGRKVLQILNEPGELQDSIQRVLVVLKTQTRADAVGIRLQDGEDFPYFAQQGFSKDFLQTENTLLERAPPDGGVCRNQDGTACLGCTCGLVISGDADPANPLFTAGGSCWTNDSFQLLDIPSCEDPRFHPRNQCVHHGYASVALVPIRNGNRIVGLIQLNDRRKGCFTPGTVELLEGIAAYLGMALVRKQLEELIRQSLGEKETLIMEIRSLNQQLEARVLERTHELQVAVTALKAEISNRSHLEREILEISECEQNRLGQDLHDGLGQELSGIAMLGDVLTKQLGAQNNPLADTAGKLVTYVRSSLESTRRLARGLYPIEIDSHGLLFALRTLAGQTSHLTGIRCELRHSGEEPKLGKFSEIHIYRIVQECIGNAVKHARPEHITIELLAEEGGHTFSVTDDGVGFVQPANHTGMGLHLMNYRARMVGAEIVMQQPADGGCRVICRYMGSVLAR